MEFLRLLRSKSAIDLRRLIAMAIIAGLSNAMVLAVINAAASPSAQSTKARLAVMFVTVVVICSISQRYMMYEASKEIERIIHRVRSRLTAAVRDSELLDIEQIGRTRIYNAISKEIQALGQNTNTLVAVSQMSLLVVFAMLYLLVLSPIAFVIAMVFMSVAVTMYLGRLKVVNKAITDSFGAEFGLHELLEGILDGFKEVKLNATRSQQISDDLLEASLEAAESRVTAQSELVAQLCLHPERLFPIAGDHGVRGAADDRHRQRNDRQVDHRHSVRHQRDRRRGFVGAGVHQRQCLGRQYHEPATGDWRAADGS